MLFLNRINLVQFKILNYVKYKCFFMFYISCISKFGFNRFDSKPRVPLSKKQGGTKGEVFFKG